MDLVNGWLSAQLAETSRGRAQMARVAKLGKRSTAPREAEIYNLERKPLVFSVFGALAEAARPENFVRAGLGGQPGGSPDQADVIEFAGLRHVQYPAAPERP